MRVVVDGRTYRVDPKKTLGEGGEASVVLCTDRGARFAVKIYKADADRRAKKLALLVELAGRLQRSVDDPLAELLRRAVVFPTALAHDAGTGALLGFAMPVLEDGLEPFAMLGKASFCASNGLGLGGLFRSLAAMGEVVRALHDAGIVIGDYNDQNELYRPRDGAIAFIDADSFQIGTETCDVATEAFLDPLLYGPDVGRPCLTADGAPRWFGRGSDWYSFAVIAFRVLTGVAPFGGTLAGFTSLGARAHARRSVLSAGVTVPEGIRLRIRALGPALTAVFHKVFQEADRRPFPLAELNAAADTVWRCSCGLEVVTPGSCPRCTVQSGTSPSAARLGVRRLAETAGRFFAVAADAAGWCALARVGDELVLHRATWSGSASSTVLGRATGASADLGPSLVVVAEPKGEIAELCVYEVATGAMVARTTTELAFGRASFAIDGDRVLRLAKGTVLGLDPRSLEEQILATVVSGATALHRGGLSATSVLGTRSYRWLRSGCSVDLDAAPLGAAESLLEEWLAAEGERAVLVRRVRTRGAEEVRTSLFDRQGRAVASRCEPAVVRTGGAAITGALFGRGSVLVASDAGLVRHDAAGAKPSVLFSETEPFVTAEAPLAASPAGVLVALGSSLDLLTLA